MKLKAAIRDEGWTEAIPYKEPEQQLDESKVAYVHRCWEDKCAAIGRNDVICFIVAEDKYFR